MTSAALAPLLRALPPTTVARFEIGARRLTMPDTELDLAWVDGQVEVIGPMRQGRATRYGIGTRVVLLSLDPVAASDWLAVPLRELADRVIDLREIDPRLASALADRLARGWSPDSEPQPAPDRMDRMATAARLLARGAPVGAVAAAVNLSDRQLARAFSHVTGLSPKRFARIARLRRAVMAAKGGEGLAQAAAGAGYSDQAHFTREMRALTGETPAKALPRVGNVQDAGGPEPRSRDTLSRGSRR